MDKLVPGTKVPDLTLPTVEHGAWCLARQRPQTFQLMVFYRGLHCPVCSRYLPALKGALADFERRGVAVATISADTEARAGQTVRSWELHGLTVAYGLMPETAKAFGLYLSAGRGTGSAGIDEPDWFCEPGLFLVRPDRTLYYVSIQSMPFARPQIDELLAAIDFILARNYPLRGDLVGIDGLIGATA